MPANTIGFKWRIPAQGSREEDTRAATIGKVDPAKQGDDQPRSIHPVQDQCEKGTSLNPPSGEYPHTQHPFETGEAKCDRPEHLIGKELVGNQYLDKTAKIQRFPKGSS